MSCPVHNYNGHDTPCIPMTIDPVQENLAPSLTLNNELTTMVYKYPWSFPWLLKCSLKYCLRVASDKHWQITVMLEAPDRF